LFNIDSCGVWTVVHPAGEVDLAVAPELRETILEAMTQDHARRLAIDLSQVTFFDSSGISVLIMALKLMRERDGHLVLVGVSERERLILEITGLSKLIDIRPALGIDEETAAVLPKRPRRPPVRPDSPATSR
jgi:anti-sigma B factor antagonist